MRASAPARVAVRLVAIAILAELVTSGASPVSGQSIVVALPPLGSTARIRWDLEIVALRLINEERATAGLITLRSHAGLRLAARSHALEMVRQGYLSHRSRDGRTAQQRVLQLGIAVRIVGENVAYATDVHAAHIAFMSSDVHRCGVLARDSRLVGIGIVGAAQGGVVIVEDFAK